MNKKILDGLQLVHFQHPADMAAQKILLQLVSCLKPEVQSMITNYESYLYARHISSSLQVNDDQLPELHKLLNDACKIVDVRLPLLFVENDSAINAWTSGSRTTFLVLTSGLVEKLNEEEILAVMGHELGHIKGQHMYYRSLANNAQYILADQAGTAAALEMSGFWLTSAIGMVQGATVKDRSVKLLNSLFEWNRAAELTADRASLLVTQDLDVTINVMAKLASGLNRHFNQQAFMKQAERFRTFGAASGDYYRRMVINQDTHPLIVLRAEELREWATSTHYGDLTNPQQPSPEIRFVCRDCSQEIVAPISLGGQVVQCPNCGGNITVPGTAAPPIIEQSPPLLS